MKGWSRPPSIAYVTPVTHPALQHNDLMGDDDVFSAGASLRDDHSIASTRLEIVPCGQRKFDVARGSGRVMQSHLEWLARLAPELSVFLSSPRVHLKLW